MKDLTKSSVAAALKQPGIDPTARRVLEIRQQSGRTSTSKFIALKNATNADKRFRGGLQFNGAARTGRWSGRTFQPQNLPRPTIDHIDTAVETILNGTTPIFYENVMAVASSSIRAMIKAPEGRKLVVSDLSGIEARVLPHLANDERALDVFRQEKDPYRVAAAAIYGVPYEAVTSEQRLVGKVSVLALGYQGATKAFLSMGKNYNVEISEEEAASIVSSYRQGNRKIVQFWYGLNDAAISAVQKPGKTFQASRILCSVQDDWLLLRLPSGRFLPYYLPELQVDEKFGKEGVTFMGIDSYTRKWTRLRTYGGSLAENCSQAVARDVMAANLPLIDAAGYQIISTVHDEVITETPDDPKYTHKELSALLATVPSWAEGLPLAAAGYESQRYRK